MAKAAFSSPPWPTGSASLAVSCLLALALPVSPLAGQVVSPDTPISLPEIHEISPQVALSGQDAVAVWLRDSFSQYSQFGYSRDGGGTWTVSSASVAGILSAPAICTGTPGSFHVVALTVRNSQKAVRVLRCSLGASGLEFDPQVAVTPIGYDQGNGVDPYDSPRIAADPDRGHVYVSYTAVVGTFNPQFQDFEYTHQVHAASSADGGQTWTPPLALGSLTSSHSDIAVGPDGEVYVVWLDVGTRELRGAVSTDFGQSYTPLMVGPANDNLGSGPPGYFWGFYRRNPVYNTCSQSLVSGFPSVAVDRSQGPYRGRVYVGWADHATEASLAPQVAAVEPIVVEASAPTAHFEIGGIVYGTTPVSILSFDGQAGTTVWLQGWIDQADTPSQPYACTTWRCSVDSLQTTWLGMFQIRHERYGARLPPLILTLPYTGRYHLRMFYNSSDFYSWALDTRVFTPDASSVSRDHRDIVLMHSDDLGATWTGKVRVNDDPPRFDNAFPKVAVDGMGRVHAAWYDRRDDVVNGVGANTYWAVSTDGGTSFQSSRRLSNNTSLWQVSLNILYDDFGNLGDHLGLAVDGDRAVVLWSQRNQPDLDVYAVTISDLPVGTEEAAGFTAETEAGSVVLRWELADASGVAEVSIERAGGYGEFASIGELAAVAGPQEFRDHGVIAGEVYRYRLRLVHRDGSRSTAGEARVSVPGFDHLHWSGVHPNPFTDRVDLDLEAPQAGEIRVQVFDLLGREVAVLHSGPLAGGTIGFTWDGRSREGRLVPAGVYLLRAVQGSQTATQKFFRR